MKTFNLDANATYGIEPCLYSHVSSRLDGALNPSSVHRGGQKARALIEEARLSLKEAVGVGHDSRVIFTSGATEANNLALFGTLYNYELTNKQSPHNQLVLSALEHPSVIEPALELRRKGVGVEIISPSVGGALSAEKFLDVVSSDTRLVSIMLANNETGEIFPVSEISRTLKGQYPNILIHCDAVQAFGKLPISFDELEVDLMSISAHKIGAFLGVGALIANKKIDLKPMIVGGAQEIRLRAGTENLPGIVAFGIQAKKVVNSLDARIEKMKSSSELFWERLKPIHDSVIINNFGNKVIPNTLSVSVPGIRADDLVIALDLRGVFISTGAACSSGKQEPSHVLLAKGFSEQEARETVRISFPHSLTEEEVIECAEIFASVIEQMSPSKFQENINSNVAINA